MAVAFWCVLVMGVMPAATVGIAKLGRVTLDGRGNHAPRDWAQSLDGFRRRAYAAHLNHFEAFPLFAAAVLVAATQGAPMATVNSLALTVVATRLVYTACYLADLATVRTLVWGAGWLLTVAIFVLPALSYAFPQRRRAINKDLAGQVANALRIRTAPRRLRQLLGRAVDRPAR